VHFTLFTIFIMIIFTGYP